MVETVLIPLAQAELTVANVLLIAVLLPDGQTGVVLSMLCEALNLRSHTQAQRLKTHPVLALALVQAQIETTGGPQVVNVLLSWGVPLWLASIRAGRRSPAYRERLLTMQREVAAALCRQFYSKLAENAATPSAFSKAPSEASPSSPWQALHTDLSALEAMVEADAQAAKARLASLEAWVEVLRAAERKGGTQERLLAATIERLLEHERRLNRLKPGAMPVKRRLARSAHKRKRRRFST